MPGFLAQRAADDLGRALFRKADQPARDRGDGIVGVARGDRHRHRLRGLEELELDVQPGVGEIAALVGHEGRGVAGEAQRADGHLGVGQRRPAQHRQGRRPAQKAHRAAACECRHVLSSPGTSAAWGAARNRPRCADGAGGVCDSNPGKINPSRARRGPKGAHAAPCRGGCAVGPRTMMTLACPRSASDTAGALTGGVSSRSRCNRAPITTGRCPARQALLAPRAASL